MFSVTVLYGLGGTVFWIVGFSAIHACTTRLFLRVLGGIARFGLLAVLALLLAANRVIVRRQDQAGGLRVLPLFHLTLLIYSVSIILDAVI
jgi:4-hydroxybenzoate polyprenyltransferase